MKKYTGLLGLEEVAEILGVTNDDVLGFIDAGLLKSFRLKEKHFIQAEGVNRLINPDIEEEAPKEKKERPEGKPDKDGWICVREGIYRKQVGKGYEYKVRVAQKVKGKRKETTRLKDYDGNKFTTLRDAETFRNKLISDLTTKTTKQQYHTVQEVYDELKKNRFSELSSGTVSKQNGNVNCHIVPYFNTTPIEEITVGDLKNLVNSKYGELKYQTLKGLYGTLKKIWAYAYEMKYISRDAYYEAFVDDVTKIKVKDYDEEGSRGVEVYTKNQMQQFYEVAEKEDPVFTMAIQIFAYTGMRQAEALALCWSDVDFKTGYITVSKQLKYDKIEHRRYFAPTKTKDTRKFMAPPILLSLLQDFKVKQEENRAKMGLDYRCYENYGGVIGADLILRYEDGKHVTSSNMCKFRERVQKRTGLHFTFHSIRHTLVSEIHGAGVPLKAVSDFIGHKDIEVTKDFYLGGSEQGDDKLTEVIKNMS